MRKTLTSELLTIRSRDAGKFWVISCCIDNPPPPPPAFLSRVLSFLASDFDFSLFFSSFFFSSFFFSSFTLSCFGSSLFVGKFSAFFLLFSLGLFLAKGQIEKIEPFSDFFDIPVIGALYQEGALFCLCCQGVRFSLGIAGHPITAKIFNISENLDAWVKLTQKSGTSF